ncbi:hypothetical protein FA15DRAFT_708051 [Coprinopsis marcescibilis]|uniref:Uncharacterized protein n=1 Tax=Coprinopsis marcescibilis TaxID=230819 RepID=A0A5C3KKR0_COPMA|nr:hypothetical protein FA15DRAFT_708051 [Coprinopsis marcescibilis]
MGPSLTSSYAPVPLSRVPSYWDDDMFIAQYVDGLQTDGECVVASEPCHGIVDPPILFYSVPPLSQERPHHPDSSIIGSHSHLPVHSHNDCRLYGTSPGDNPGQSDDLQNEDPAYHPSTPPQVTYLSHQKYYPPYSSSLLHELNPNMESPDPTTIGSDQGLAYPLHPCTTRPPPISHRDPSPQHYAQGSLLPHQGYTNAQSGSTQHNISPQSVRTQQPPLPPLLNHSNPHCSSDHQKLTAYRDIEAPQSTMFRDPKVPLIAQPPAPLQTLRTPASPHHLHPPPPASPQGPHSPIQTSHVQHPRQLNIPIAAPTPCPACSNALPFSDPAPNYLTTPGPRSGALLPVVNQSPACDGDASPAYSRKPSSSDVAVTRFSYLAHSIINAWGMAPEGKLDTPSNPHINLHNVQPLPRPNLSPDNSITYRRTSDQPFPTTGDPVVNPMLT